MDIGGYGWMIRQVREFKNSRGGGRGGGGGGGGGAGVICKQRSCLRDGQSALLYLGCRRSVCVKATVAVLRVRLIVLYWLYSTTIAMSKQG
jgi:hypothetical protein